MIKILFICHGNICRSPMAEFMLKDMVDKQGLADQFQIASAATSREEIGNPVYPPAKKKLAQVGISSEGKRAVQVTEGDYDQYDYILLMDQNNQRNLKRIIQQDLAHKIHRLLDFSGNPRNIEDPWYTGDFEKTYQDILEGCQGFLDYLTEKGEISRR